MQNRFKLCKSWGCPVVSMEELCSFLKYDPCQNQKDIVRNELIYFKKSYYSKVKYKPDFFKVNGNTHKETLLNLCALVAEDDECSCALYQQTLMHC